MVNDWHIRDHDPAPSPLDLGTDVRVVALEGRIAPIESTVRAAAGESAISSPSTTSASTASGRE